MPSIKSIPAGLGRLHNLSAARYLVSTAILFTVNFGVTVLLREGVALHEWIAFPIALAISFVLSFVLMRYYIYRSIEASWVKQFLLYCPSAAMFRGLEYVSFVTVTHLFDTDYRILIVIVLTLSAVSKFVYYRYLIFRP